MTKIGFKTMSTVKCNRCGKPLKLRVVVAKQPQNIIKCYKCYSAVRYYPAFDGGRRCVTSHNTALGY